MEPIIDKVVFIITSLACVNRCLTQKACPKSFTSVPNILVAQVCKVCSCWEVCCTLEMHWKWLSGMSMLENDSAAS